MLHSAGVIGLTTARCEKAKINNSTEITLTDFFFFFYGGSLMDVASQTA